MRKIFITLSLLIALSMLFAACAPQPAAEPETITVVETQIVEKEVIVEVEPEMEEGPKTLRFNVGYTDIPTLDPAVAEDVSAIQIIEETIIGLTTLDEVTSETQPGMAESWDIVDNDDGTQTITFNMRQGIPWVFWNGEAVETVKTCEGDSDRFVTAQDFAYGLERNQNPSVASPYAYLLGYVLKGAAEYNAGETDDFSTVGVEVIDDYTIALTFLAPAAYNAQIAGLWVARPQPQWVIEGDDCNEARGDRWIEPGFFQSYGPYTVSEWIHDSSLTLVVNPYWPGTEANPTPKIEMIEFSMLDEAVAFAEYEAGNLDTAALPGTDYDRVIADPVLSAELVSAPTMCSYYYGFNTQADFVNDVRVRRALSQAVDRQGLIDNVLKGGQQPAQWFSRPGLAGAPTMETHPDLGVKFDPDAAKAELDAYLAETGLTADQLDITLMFNTSSGHQRIAEAIQQMWAEYLGINVQLVNQEWAVYLDTVDSKNTPQVWRLGWCQDYPDANNFIREVFASGGASNPTEADGSPAGGVQWYNEEFEALVAEAAVELDPAVRLDLYAQAEQILNYDDAAIIPIYFYARQTLTKPYVVRTFGAGGQERFEKWDILPE